MTRVLVIDDEAPIRLLCRVNLEAEGMDVLEAADGPSGLDKARAERPDVILLDVMMPAMDGWQVAELNSQSFSPALNLNLRWLYLSSVAGGALIVIYSAASIADGWRGRWPAMPGAPSEAKH